MAEPLTLTEAKSQLRVTDTNEDTLISDYIVSARVWIENYTRHILVSGTFEDTFGAWGGYLELSRRPVTALGDVTYTDIDGEEAEYADGVLRAFSYPAKVYPPDGQPFPTLGTGGGITVEYTAGYASAAEVPKDIKQATRVLVTCFHQNRGELTEEAERAVKNLLASYRKPPLA